MSNFFTFSNTSNLHYQLFLDFLIALNGIVNSIFLLSGNAVAIMVFVATAAILVLLLFKLYSMNHKIREEVRNVRKMENELIRVNKVLADFRKAVDVSAIISITDPKGTITYANNNFVKISGYSKQELIGQNHRIINSGFHDRSFWTHMWKTIASGKVWRNEVKNKAKDGKYYWVDTHIVPFLDNNGRIQQFLSIRNEITEKKAAEQELLSLNLDLELRVYEKTKSLAEANLELTRMNLLMETVQKHARIGIWEYNIEDGTIFWSEELFMLYEAPRLNNVSLNDNFRYVHPDFREVIEVAIEKAISKGKSWDVEIKSITHRNNEIWVRSIGFALREGGKTVSLQGLLQDITRRKKAEIEITSMNALLESHSQKLETINRELESFTYSVSHDLRAPLRSIYGYSEILKEDYAAQLDEEGKKALNIVIRNADRMGRLIDDLLEFSRMGRKGVEKSNVNIQQMVENITNELASHEKGRTLDFIIHPVEPANADAQMLRQVWVNLISNAIKYTQKIVRPVVEIGSIANEEKVTYYIKDNGIGFNMKYVGKLFEVFQRLHRADEFEGTGVGLALSKRIVQRHGGEIWAEAEENQGATFYFTLPKNHD